jgi:hypothetical protein
MKRDVSTSVLLLLCVASGSFLEIAEIAKYPGSGHGRDGLSWRSVPQVRPVNQLREEGGEQ